MGNRGLIYSNPNLLINADGTDPLDQRGSDGTNISSGSYTIDRWNTEHNATTVGLAVQVGGGTRATITTLGAGTYFLLKQRIESLNALEGRVVTLSASIKSNTVGAKIFVQENGGTAQQSATHTGGGGFEVLSVTSTLASSLTSLDLGILIQTTIADTDYIEFEWIKLEVGSVATPFVADLPGVNLAKCQRYYQQYGGEAYSRFGPCAIYTSATNADVQWGIPEMRVTPVISSSGNFTFLRGDLTGTITGITLYTESDKRTAVLSINGTGFSGTVAGLSANNDANAYIALNAEL